MIRLFILGQPDGRVAAEAKLMDDAITPITKRVMDADGMKSARFIILRVLDIFQNLIWVRWGGSRDHHWLM